jgi:TonB-linked SusC/RagA family outer membrane protein
MKEKQRFLNPFWGIMKLTLYQIFLCAVFTGMVSATTINGQDLLKQKITVNISDQKVRDALKIIEGNSNVKFVYSSRIIDVNRRVNLSVNNSSMAEVLDKLLRPLNLKYEISGRQIVLDKIGKEALEAPVQDAFEHKPETLIKGKVTDEKGEGLPGVSILLKGTQQGTTSNEKGEYSLDTPENQSVLIFSYVGYLSQEVIAGNKTTIDIVLKTDNKALEEVVVVGYGEQKKVNLTGAVGVISAKEFESRPVANITQSLQGQVPGLLVNQTGGQPGSESFTIKIRGTSTFSNNEPLVIVDGIAMSLANLNPQDIESMSVLKDAASAAIYGARASGGVILVTTKKGRDGKLKISYDGYIGRQSPTMLPKMVDAYHHVMLWREAELNDNPKTTVFKYSLDEMEKYRTGALPSEDRLAYLFRPATQTQHNVSLSGGTAKNSYYLSVGYINQGGLMVNTSSERMNIRVNNTFKVNDRFDVNVNAQLSPSVRNAPSEASYPSGPTRGVNDIIHDAYRRGSDDVTYTSDGRWASITGWANRFGLASRDGGFQKRNFNRLTGALTMNYKITKDITLTGIYGSKIDLIRKTDYSKRMEFINPDDLKTIDFNYNTNSLLVAHHDIYQHNAQFLANYNKIFNKSHEFKLLLGASQEWNKATQDSVGRRNFINDDIYVINAGSNDPATWTTGGTASAWAIRSFFARANYIFKDKYLFEANVRYDGSSRFSSKNRWGIFPSFSAGWRVSEEAFMAGFRNYGNLKLRGSWGKVGNQNVALYQYYSTISSSAYYFNGAAQTATYYSGSPNVNLQWETKTTTNIGLDMGLFNGKLNLTLDVFKDKTDGILMQPAVPSSYGLSAPFQNVATVNNFGWESQISYQDRRGAFSYKVSFQISDARNKVKSMVASPQISANKITETGHEMSEWFGYKSIGIFASQSEVDSYARLNTKTGVGDLKIEDVNNDGKITAADRQRLGSSFTRLPYGFHVELGYKNFDFTTFLQGVAYRKAYMNSVALPINGSLETAQVQHLDRWHLDENNNWIPGQFPKMRIASFNNAFSSYWLQNAAYLRMKHIQLGYSLPKTVLDRVKMERLRIYVSGENLFTFTKVTGYDPEAPDGPGNFYPLSRVINLGVNLTF